MFHDKMSGALRLYAFLRSLRLAEYSYPLPIVEKNGYMVVGSLQSKALIGKIAHSP